jgi:hypothetical protein
VSFFHHYGTHVPSINNISLKITNEKIIYLNGSFYTSGGTGKYYADKCDIFYDSINSINNIHCKVLDGYDKSVNVSDVEMKRNNFYSGVIDEFNDENYSLMSTTHSLVLVTLSDKKRDLLKTLNKYIEYNNLTDAQVIKSGDCFYWNITYGGFSEYTACFNDGLIHYYHIASSSFGYIDDQEWIITSMI